MRVRKSVAAMGALLVAISVACALPAHVSAQTPSLGDVAKKEQARRKKAGTAPKVWTNKDLPNGGAPKTPPAQAASGGDAAAQAAQEKAPDQPKEEKDEAWWRARIGNAREELRRNEAFLEALQSRVNALSTDFVNRDDPYQRAQIGLDRQKALAEMDRVKGEIERLKKDIDDIEEEARKAGVPPGWLR
jgi:hypothetical protein